MNTDNQASLDKWLFVKTDSQAKIIVPSIFYLHCNDKYFTAAKWYSNNNFHHPIENEYTLQWTIAGRKGKSLPIRVIHGSLPINNDIVYKATSQLSIKLHGNSRSIPYLKSHLQKCIRKGNAELAVSTAKELLEIDVLQIVRRLSIIMVEDVDLHPSLNILMWWTIVLSKQSSERKQNGLTSILKASDVPLCLSEWLLGVVHVLCKHSHRRIFSCIESSHTTWQRIQQLYEWKKDVISPHYLLQSIHNTLYSVLLRTTYGGLKGDIILLHAVVTEYYNEFLKCNQINKIAQQWNIQIIPIVYNSVKVLKNECWDLDAIDFHIAPHLISKLQNKIQNNQNNIDVKRMMWENGSSINIRDNIFSSEYYAFELWQKILPSVRQWQIFLLNK